MVRKIFLLNWTVAPFSTLDLLRDACTCVFLSISQVSLPQATCLRVGALYLEAPQSSSVEVVWSWGEVFTINGALFDAFDALPTEQVPTTGLHWVRDQLQTDGTLQIFQRLQLSVYKRVCHSSVAERWQGTTSHPLTGFADRVVSPRTDEYH